ncbi:hypothetical protein, partial [Chryseobacterium artocarpi]|uniref:hypothetical protein n=1 Tax=Chryseobacterium artocarpi TaxID=1414727 RepID=UPI003F39A6A0
AERNNISKSARSVLLEDFNDIDIYVEDTSIETSKLYSIILNIATKNKHKLNNVFPVGNSESVIKDWKKHKLINDGRKKLFIIDGDFYIINNNIEDQINDPSINDFRGLFILPRYCIENFLLEEKAILSVVHDDEPTKHLDEIESTINYDNWIVSNENLLIDLFILYSIIIKYKLGIQNIQYGVNKLCKDSTGIVCSLKTNAKIEEIKADIIKKTEEKNIHLNLEAEIEHRKQKISASDIKLLTFVSGKDYLIPLLKSRIKSKNKFNPDNISFKIRLAKNCKFNSLSNIYDNILE